ncbi:hypothetical protein BDW74DRAFT_147395 [Aspergillus multicolor]|uniref:uncharacterized protein n=1 Tax=Aspergillus multicolor TaxID=41759 RepID=UPI003CCCC36F
MEAFRCVAEHYARNGKLAEATKVIEEAVGIHESTGSKPTRAALECFRVQRLAWYENGELLPCINCGRPLLSLLERLKCVEDNAELIFHYRWKTQVCIGNCFAQLDNLEEAKGWYLLAADSLQLLGLDKPSNTDTGDLEQLAAYLAFAGEYVLSEFMFKKVCSCTGALYEEKRAIPGFYEIQPLIDKLLQQEIIDSDYNDLLSCFTCGMALDPGRRRRSGLVVGCLLEVQRDPNPGISR